MPVINPIKAKRSASITGEQLADAIEALNHCAHDIVRGTRAESNLRYVAMALIALRDREIGSIIRK